MSQQGARARGPSARVAVLNPAKMARTRAQGAAAAEQDGSDGIEDRLALQERLARLERLDRSPRQLSSPISLQFSQSDGHLGLH